MLAWISRDIALHWLMRAQRRSERAGSIGDPLLHLVDRIQGIATLVLCWRARPQRAATFIDDENIRLKDLNIFSS